MHYQALPDRPCDTCDRCCIALTIDDPELQKPQGYRCRNLVVTGQAGRCGIYATRPQQCRSFDCAWRVFRWIKPSLRPDRSDVLIRLVKQADERLGISVMLLEKRALKAEGLAETVAAAVAAGLPVYLNIPGPPGYTSAAARIDEALAVAVATKDKQAVLAVLRDGYRQGKAGETKPIRRQAPRPPPPGATLERDDVDTVPTRDADASCSSVLSGEVSAVRRPESTS